MFYMCIKVSKNSTYLQRKMLELLLLSQAKWYISIMIMMLVIGVDIQIYSDIHWPANPAEARGYRFSKRPCLRK